MNGKASLVGLSSVLLAMANVVVMRTHADATFLSGPFAHYLAHYMIGSTAVFACASAAYGALSRRVPAAILDAAALILLAIVAASAEPVLRRHGAATLIVPLCTVALASVANLAAWNALTTSSEGRSMRKLLPFAGGAATAGGMAGGFLSAATISWSGVSALPWVVVFLSFLLFLGSRAAPRRAAGTAARRAPRGDTEEVVPPEARSLRAWLIGAALAEAAVGTMLDFQYKSQLQRAFGKNEIGTFLAAFYGVTNAGVLVLQFVAVPRMLATRSLGFSFSLHPAALLIGFAAWAFAPGLAVATSARAVDMVLKFSISRASQEVSLSPLPPQVRGRWNMFLRGGAAQVGAGAAGLMLVALSSTMQHPRIVALFGLLITGAWLFSVRRAARSYLSSLGVALGMRKLVLDSEGKERTTFSGLDREGLGNLIALAGHEDPRMARFGNALLQRAYRLAGELIPHLAHPQPRARAALYAACAARPDHRAAAALRAAVLAETDEIALARGLAALAAHGDDSAVERASSLAGRGGPLGAAATMYLAQRGRLDPVTTWKLVLETLEQDGAAAASLMAGELSRRRRSLGELFPELDARHRSHVTVARKESFRCALLLDAPLSIQRLLDALEHGDHAAASALREAPEKTLRKLASLSRTHKGGARTRARLARALRDSEDGVGAVLLLEFLSDDEPLVREVAARALAYRALSFRENMPSDAVDRALRRELGLLAVYLDAWAPAGARPALHEDELRRQSSACMDRVLAIAALGGNMVAVRAAARRLQAGEDAERRSALDLLQEVARGDSRQELLSLVASYLNVPQDMPEPGSTQAVMAEDPWLRRVLGGELDTLADRLLSLRRTPLFQDLPGDALVPLAEAMTEVSASPGHDIVRQGEPGDALYVLLTGNARILQDERQVGRVESGTSFGELALIDGGPRSATVRAAEPCQLLRLARQAFEEAWEKTPEIGRGLLSSLAKAIREGG
ncbi:MAG: cyclic nucleotide-binding domain-containing protein [Deltaproteobacteria bacterium]|nr:cyclic nucleotide-binding domain-containing protein [Deltaproteobacteria bacterium]